MITLAVLDMAGTTIDDRDEVYRVLRAAAERGGARFDDGVFQRFMGTEKRYAIGKLLAAGGVEASEERIEECWQWFRAELRRTYTEQPPTPLPGIEGALRALRDRGVKVGPTTGFSREIVDLILAGLGWEVGGLLDASAAGDEVEAGRPQHHLIRAVMDGQASPTPLGGGQRRRHGGRRALRAERRCHLRRRADRAPEPGGLRAHRRGSRAGLCRRAAGSARAPRRSGSLMAAAADGRRGPRHRDGLGGRDELPRR